MRGGRQELGAGRGVTEDRLLAGVPVAVLAEAPDARGVPRDDTERAARYEDDPWRPGQGPLGREQRPYRAEHRSHHGPPGPVAQRVQRLLPAPFARGELRRSLLRVGEHTGAFRRRLQVAVQWWAARLEQLRQRDRGRGRAGAEDQRTAGEPAVGHRHSGHQVHQRVGVRGGEARGQFGRAGGAEERPGTRPFRGSPARSERLERLAPQTAGDGRGVVGCLRLSRTGGRRRGGADRVCEDLGPPLPGESGAARGVEQCRDAPGGGGRLQHQGTAPLQVGHRVHRPADAEGDEREAPRQHGPVERRGQAVVGAGLEQDVGGQFTQRLAEDLDAGPLVGGAVRAAARGAHEVGLGQLRQDVHTVCLATPSVISTRTRVNSVMASSSSSAGPSPRSTSNSIRRPSAPRRSYSWSW